MRLVLVLSGMLAGPAMADDLRVVTDLPAVHSVTEMVLGAGRAELLLPEGGDPHHMALRPSDAARIADADLVIWAGPATSPWLARALDAASITDLALGDGDGHGDHAEHDHGAAHPWLDPHVVQDWAADIGEALAAADAENAALYQANAQAAIALIEATEADARALLVPVANRPIIVQHDAYAEFAETFGLTIAGALTDADGSKAGARQISELRRMVEAGDIGCVFAEVGHDAQRLSTVTESANIPLGTLDPLGRDLATGPDLYPALILGLAREIAGCGG